jgi:hypothetical protein
VLGITKSRIASGGVIIRTAKSIPRTDIVGLRRRIPQPGCPEGRLVIPDLAAFPRETFPTCNHLNSRLERPLEATS